MVSVAVSLFVWLLRLHNGLFVLPVVWLCVICGVCVRFGWLRVVEFVSACLCACVCACVCLIVCVRVFLNV